MNWDPITRIVGSLGIFTKIDFDNRAGGRVPQHLVDLPRLQHLHEGQGPARRPLHHQPHLRHLRRQPRHLRHLRAEHGLRHQAARPWREWIVNLGEAAEYMFDHNIFQDNLVGVDFCEQMVKETNPGVLATRPRRPPAPHADMHGYRTIADIMRALNPFTGEFYREALQMSRMTREMFCLMEGRHVHPSTLYPGGVGTVPTVQLFTDYLVRLMKYVEFMKKVVPLHDDLFDFFYEALPGYEEVGQRRDSAGLLGLVQQSRRLRLHLQEHDRLGPRRCSSRPAWSSTASWSPPTWSTSISNIRILLGSSYYDDWQNARDVRQDTIRWAIPSTSAIPGTRPPSRGRRSATSTASTPGSCRRAGTTSAPAIIWRSTPAAARSPASGPPRWPAWSTSATSRPPATA